MGGRSTPLEPGLLQVFQDIGRFEQSADFGLRQWTLEEGDLVQQADETAADVEANLRGIPAHGSGAALNCAGELAVEVAGGPTIRFSGVETVPDLDDVVPGAA